MARLGLGFPQRDNAFVRLDDPRRAQTLADKFARVKWPSILNASANKVNPLRRDVLKQEDYVWVTDLLATVQNGGAGEQSRRLNLAARQGVSL